MREVVIASSVRTPVGKAFKGTLRTTRPDELRRGGHPGSLGPDSATGRSARLKT